MGAKGDVRMCPSLGLEQVQHIQLTTEVRQGIEVMGMPILELRALLSNKAMENPFLRSAESPFECRFPHEEFESIASRTPEKALSLEEEILAQLNMDLRDEMDIRIAQELISGIDEQGYLRLDTDIVADALGTDPNRVERVLKKMQTECAPAGIGARSLQERLIAQLQATGDDDLLVRRIIENHLPDLADGRILQIASALGTTASCVQHVLERIRRLDPHPAACFEHDGPTTFPEVIVIKSGTTWSFKLRKGLLPQILLDEGYASMLDDPAIDKRTAAKMREMLREAKGLIRAVDLRKAAIIAISDAVINHQSHFFDRGPAGLRPLAMADVAQMTGLSEPTVCRVANSVTLDTPKGVLDLRYFFHSGVGSRSASEDVSSLAVKQAIKELVGAEDKHDPLSDGKLVDMLAARGMSVSRRTVNKYRTALGILSCAKRRRYDE